ncbi:hypothetical protein [Pseudomonas chlororaphis]|uniref:Cap15 family cyclic dinucleotide receptor domain-containing protein n=1 Tax=Pseudomonas chlororaphis TaxID=587753 RepID=UPI002407E249|nr:hypothetical protein [Pseudomonas chlororaphis]
MFKIVRFDLVLKYMVLITVGLSIVLYAVAQFFWFPDLSLFKVVAISSGVSAFLVFALLTQCVSRNLWALIGWFDGSLFPDLNGTWEGEIFLENGSSLQVRAVIRQSLLTTQIDMHGETTKSVTLEATPTVEQGQNKLYYVYRSVPKTPGRYAYTGSTIFDVRRVEVGGEKKVELSGYYYTDRKTSGRVRIMQVCKNSSRDVSFY